MKKLIYKILNACFLFLLITESSFSQLHYLEKYDGIPIMAFTNRTSSETTNDNLDMLKELGVMGIWASDLDQPNYERITGRGIKVFPYQIDVPQNNWVVYYTNAIYTKWEAEGKGNGNNGDMELKFNSSIGDTFYESSSIQGIKTTSNKPDILIYGPWYYQAVKYKALPWPPANINYTANYKLKIKQINNLPQGYLDSVVCTIKITDRGIPPDAQEYTHYDTTLKVRDFLNSSWGNGWDQWSTFKKEDYTIEDTVADNYWNLWMQYKIEWAGRTFLELYIDYILIHEDNGLALKNLQLPKDRIKIQVIQYADTSGVLGWFGLNEPPSIDNYEPFRIVDSVINYWYPNLHLYTTFYTGAGGRFGVFWPENFPGNGAVQKGVEFYKRSKLPFVSFNNYMYNDPWAPPGSNWPHTATDYELRNINEVIFNNLDELNAAGVPFSYSTQTGTFYNFDTLCNNEFERFYVPTPAKMLYHINLGLLYCMKELTCDPFFTLPNLGPCPGEFYREGLVDALTNQLSELGHTWKDTVAPRMSGLLGKTIRKLQTKNQYLEIDIKIDPESSTPHEYIEFMESTGGPNDTCFIDLGTFENPTDPENKYFMPVNRYYSTLHHITFGLRQLLDYNNWSITDYMDTTSFTVVQVDGKAEFIDDIYPGDAKLYSILPVVKYGGTLIADEPAGEGQILNGDMIIDNDATLSIYDTYTVKGNITIKNGNIVCGVSGKIIFKDGKKLIIDGPAYVQGTESDKLILEFELAAGQDEAGGIVIKPNASLNISYCEINNASTGILSEVNANYLSCQYIDFNDCVNSSISILGNQGDGESTPPPPQIKFCNINYSDYGISVSNLSQVVIQQNLIINTDLGIYLSNVTTPLIIDNVISSSSPNLQGIPILSSGGVVRGNQINGHTNGIHLGNSSPDIGGNTIENNINRGLYSGLGSLPNLRAKIVQDPVHPNIFYAVSGYNKIRDNGGLTQEDLGSEIFIYHSNVLLKGGCNEITDQRIPNTENIPPLYHT